MRAVSVRAIPGQSVTCASSDPLPDANPRALQELLVAHGPQPSGRASARTPTTHAPWVYHLDPATNHVYSATPEHEPQAIGTWDGVEISFTSRPSGVGLFQEMDRFLKEHRVHLKEVFERFDRGGKNYLSGSELRLLVRELMPQATEEDLRYLEVMIDAKRDGRTTLRKLLAVGAEVLALAAAAAAEQPWSSADQELLYRCSGAGLLDAMDVPSRRAWRQVNKGARDAVYQRTTSLTLRGSLLRPLLLLSRCKQLTRLDVRDQSLFSRGVAVLAPVLAELGGLQQLCVRGNSFGMKGAEALAPALSKLQALQELDLAQNAFGARGAAALAPALRQLPGLQRLGLGFNVLGHEGAALLAPALEGLKGLRQLELSSNGLGSGGAGARAAGAEAKKHGGPRRAGLAPDPKPQGLSALVLAIKGLSSLQQLDLSENSLDAEDAAVLAPALRELTCLQHLDLGRNLLRGDGAAILGPVLGQLKGLQHLDLRRNGLDARAAEALAPALKQLQRLRVLDLGSNGLDELAAAHLAPALSLLRELQQLDLRANSLDARGAAALAPALSMLRELHTLNLSQNTLGDYGAAALVPFLKQLPLLQHLSFRYNGLGACFHRPEDFEGEIVVSPEVEELMVFLRKFNAF